MKFDLEKDFLPVGSIVSIRFNRAKYMIMGYGTKDAETNEVYDYIAVLYPTGLVSLDNVMLLNRSYVKRIYHTGYINDECKAYLTVVNAAMEKHNNKDKKNEE